MACHPHKIPGAFCGQDEEKWDFVLVSDIHEVGSKKEIKRKKFLDELSKKGFTIKVRGCRGKRQQLLGHLVVPRIQASFGLLHRRRWERPEPLSRSPCQCWKINHLLN